MLLRSDGTAIACGHNDRGQCDVPEPGEGLTKGLKLWDQEVADAYPSEDELQWVVPETGYQPIAEVGIVLTASEGRSNGRVLVERLWWDGCPDVTFKRPAGSGDFWRRAWVSNVHFFSKHFVFGSICISCLVIPFPEFSEKVFILILIL